MGNKIYFKKKENNNIKDIKLLNNLVIDTYDNLFLNDTFLLFKSINNIFILIYTNLYRSILSYDIIDNKKINEIKNAHLKYITNFRHYLDNINKRDLFLSISSYNNNLKMWDIRNFECLLEIKDIYEKGSLYSACFLNDNNDNFIVTSNGQLSYGKNEELIKVFDFEGKKIKEINNSNENTFFIDIYYDKKLLTNYIITCNNYFSKSYNYNKNEIYKKYYDNSIPYHIVIDNKEEKIKLIESCKNGYIRIWDFHFGILSKKIRVSYNGLSGICLWENEYLFVGCDDKTIKLVDYNNEKIIKELTGHNNKIVSIKKINHPRYGKCLFSQALILDPIKIWN